MEELLGGSSHAAPGITPGACELRLPPMAKSALRRHHRARVIARRRFIVRNVWYSGYSGPEGRLSFSEAYADCPGVLDKHNLVCSCGICRRPKWRNERAAQCWRWDGVGE